MATFLSPWQPCLHEVLVLATSAYVLGLWWFTRGIGVQPPSGQEALQVSVVVAVRNEEARIGALLDGLKAQTYPVDRWEVIVVDDGSVDGTAALVEARRGGHLRLLKAQGSGKKAALSQGIAAAGGEVILTTDGDCEVPPGWVEGMAAHFGPQVQMVVGFSQICRPGGATVLLAGLQAIDFLNLMGAALGSAAQGCALAASGQNLAFRKEAFNRVGGYGRVQHRASGDDVLLLQLIRRLAGGRIAFATSPSTFVVHPPAASWGTLLSQRARWASNAPYQLLLNPAFFAYITMVFSVNLLLVLSPLLVLTGGLGFPVAGAIWGGKVLAEGIFCWRATALFNRRELRRFFPWWTLVQPFYLVLAGLLGSLGLFTWKGRKHRWGKGRGSGLHT